MTGWIDRSSTLASNRKMDAEFYFDWEMHMGGCGGYMTSHSVSNTRAALGLPFGKCHVLFYMYAPIVIIVLLVSHCCFPGVPHQLDINNTFLYIVVIYFHLYCTRSI